MGSGPARVILLTDGIRGHEHQSLGIARWLERLCGAEVQRVPVPRLTGAGRFLRLKLQGRLLPHASPKWAKAWLKGAGLSPEGLNGGPDALFIAAGSSAAPFCLAGARVASARSAIVMTPSVLGTGPFDFAIVPEHDHPAPAANLMTTLGAPNHIYPPDLRAATEKTFPSLRKFPPKVIALLIGGSDANYELGPDWVRAVLPPLRAAAEAQGTMLLVTTSRRTGPEADGAVEAVLGGSPALGYLVLASREPDNNPIPAMLGAATHVLVTEDSVSMASEAATAGFRAGLLRVGRRRGPLVGLRGFFGGGTARFDALFEALAKRGLLQDLGQEPDFRAFLAPAEARTSEPFSEAKRAAEWILTRWEERR